MKTPLLLLAAAGLFGITGNATPANAQATPRALVYCPANIDTNGCEFIVGALSAGGRFSVDRGYNGTSYSTGTGSGTQTRQTLDLATADLTVYSVVVVPALADVSTSSPYALLRTNATVQANLRSALNGRVAVWSGVIDQGNNTSNKETHNQQLATWAAGAYDASRKGGTGLVVLRDGSTAAERYGWLASVAGVSVEDDGFVRDYGKVGAESGSTAFTPIVGSLAYQAMATRGLRNPSTSATPTRTSAVDAHGLYDSGNTKDVAGQKVLVTFVPSSSGGGGTTPPAKSNQTITFDQPTTPAAYNSTFSVSATASSGLTVSFAVDGVCSLASGSVTMTSGTGSCTITASQAGNDSFNAAESVVRTVAASKANATVSVTGGTFTYDGTPRGASGTATGVDGSNLSSLLNLGSSFTNVPGGTANWSFAGDDNHHATSGTASIVINKASQTITFDALADKTFGDAAFAVSGSASSGLTLSFAAGGSCTISGATVNITGAGSCTVTARQAGDDNFGAATDVSRTFSIAKASTTINLSNLEHTYDGTAKAATATTAQAGLTGVTIRYDGSASAPTNAGSYAVEASLTDDNYQATDATGTLTIAKAAGSVIISNLPPTATFGGSFTPAYATAGDGAGSTTSLSTSVCTVSGGVVNYVGTGSCQLQTSVDEGTNHLAATGPAQSFTVGAASTTTTVTVTPSTQQYSDLVTLNATVRSDAAGTQGGTVQFKIDGVNVGAPQTLSNGEAPLASYQVAQAPGARSVTAEFTSTNAIFAGSTSTAETLTVTPEDARATYTGLEFVTTSSASTTSANVVLSATIQDISAIAGDPDTNAGDIRNARVRFLVDGTERCSNLTPALVSATDLRTGTVSCTVSLSSGSSGSTQYTVSVVVNGHYNGNSGGDVVTVAQPVNGMITGGGHLVAQTSAGQYAAGAGLKTNLGFNVKYNKNMTSLQGGANIIIRAADGKVYQIKSNSMNSLSTNTSTGVATFMSKANLADITDPANPIALGGNLDLQMTLKDNGTPGTLDTIGLTLRNSAGALLFSSRWSGTVTQEQNLNGGNLVVR